MLFTGAAVFVSVFRFRIAILAGFADAISALSFGTITCCAGVAVLFRVGNPDATPAFRWVYSLTFLFFAWNEHFAYGRIFVTLFQPFLKVYVVIYFVISIA